jgi:hypothetical protein
MRFQYSDTDTVSDVKDDGCVSTGTTTTMFSLFRVAPWRNRTPSLRERNCCLVRLLISHTFLANEHCFSLTTNQPTVFFSLTFQQSEQGL